VLGTSNVVSHRHGSKKASLVMTFLLRRGANLCAPALSVIPGDATCQMAWLY
jgi:hypothetical protein